ncbi:MAG: transcriptional regulator, LacI family [Sphaerisporangium sp.]|nr:transcriptional regulator, LacI family [Sphaerisporangium sp.]
MVTLEAVAKEAGVSLATASRVLNGSTRQVGALTRTRVESAAAKLRYRVDSTAQTLARGMSNVVGLIVQDLTDPYFAAIADGVMRAADLHDMVVTIGTTRRDPEREIAHVASLTAQRTRVVLIAGSRDADDVMLRRFRAELDVYRATGGQVAIIGEPAFGVDTVSPLNHEGAYQLARALAGRGHQRFAVLAGPVLMLTAVERTAGFLDGLSDLGFPAPVLLHSRLDRNGGHDSALELLDMNTDVTCVFAVTDAMAVGALAAFRERGVQVPRDLSLAGFEDIPPLRDVVPALTTVRLPLARMGALALELALSHEDVPRVEPVPGEVVLRESVSDLTGASSDLV